MSIEALTDDKDAAMIWRGPLKGRVIKQFIADIEWKDLDFMIIDCPPGTGDEPLTVSQTIPDVMALIVTTPQEISLADVRKSINFCRIAPMKILGLVENMSGLMCPHCGKLIELFKMHGGLKTADREHIRFLGSLPMEPEIVRSGNIGGTDILENDQIPFTQSFNRIVDKIERVLNINKII